MIRCLACGGPTRFATRRTSRLDATKEWDVFRCDDCSSFTADCPYVPEQYNAGYSLIRENPRINDPQMLHYAKLLDKLVQENYPGHTILDVGCGSGKFLYAYSRTNRSARLNGLEINPGAVKKVREQLPEGNIYCGYGELGDMTFDVVCSWNVIEHVPDPYAFLSELARHTNVGGLVAISTPNHTQINRWRYGIHKWETINPPLHLCIMSRPALKRMFSQCTLMPIHLSTFSWNFGGRLNPPRWWKLKYLLPCLFGKLRLGGNLLMIGRKLDHCD